MIVFIVCFCVSSIYFAVYISVQPLAATFNKRIIARDGDEANGLEAKAKAKAMDAAFRHI